MMEKEHAVAIEVNGKVLQAELPARLTLVDFLRDEARLTGTHVGCEHGICGACSVLFDGLPVRSCLMFAWQADGHKVAGLGACRAACAAFSDLLAVRRCWYSPR